MSSKHLNLGCPNCMRLNSVAILSNQFKRSGGPNGTVTSYRATCGTKHQNVQRSGCGYRISDLEAKSLDEAVKAWEDILAISAEARRILGVNMEEQQELDLNGAPAEVTEWINSRDFPPEWVGWFETRLVMGEQERAVRMPTTQRRWWFGNGWSRPVEVGVDDDDFTANQGDKRSQRDSAQIEYRGLSHRVFIGD